MKESKYILKTNLKHLKLLEKSVYIYESIRRGDFIALSQVDFPSGTKDHLVNPRKWLYSAILLKMMLIPETEDLGPMSTLIFCGDNIDEETRIAYDIEMVIKKYLAKINKYDDVHVEHVANAPLIEIKNDRNRHILYCRDKHLRVVVRALDLYSRLCLGQFNMLTEVTADIRWERKKGNLPREQYEIAALALRNAMSPAFGEFNSVYSSYGIHAPEVSDNARVAYDMIQVIRHQLWLDSKDKPSYIVDAYEARQIGKESLISIRKE